MGGTSGGTVIQPENTPTMIPAPIALSTCGMSVGGMSAAALFRYNMKTGLGYCENFKKGRESL
jgi:hypothetical protein